MIGMMLQWAGFGAGFQDLLSQLDSLGFFTYVLPFLLIFAFVYAILCRINIFSENKGAAVLIAFAIGLLSLQLNFVPAFFQRVFPSFGIGLSLLLVALILAGAFISDKEAYKWVFFGLGVFVALVVIVTSLSDWQFVGSYWWNRYGALVITLLVVIGAVVGVILAGKK